jgi:septal ring factor EnvC (AmiA/AmiB activator)
MADRMKLPSEIDTPLDRRAMTIDVLASEIERKNRTIKAWRIKCDELEEKIGELENDNQMMGEELAELQTKKKSNGKAKDERLR